MMRDSSVHVRFHREDIANHEVLFRFRNVVIMISISLRPVFSAILSSKEAAYAKQRPF